MTPQQIEEIIRVYRESDSFTFLGLTEELVRESLTVYPDAKEHSAISLALNMVQKNVPMSGIIQSIFLMGYYNGYAAWNRGWDDIDLGDTGITDDSKQ